MFLSEAVKRKGGAWALSGSGEAIEKARRLM